MISYRALKKLIGETSLERKCRFLFGLALLVLITTSFYLYARRTRSLVESQQILAARGLVFRLVQLRHYQLFIRGNAANALAARSAASDPATESQAGNKNQSTLLTIDDLLKPPSISDDQISSEEEISSLMDADREALISTTPGSTSDYSLQQLQSFEAALNQIPETSAGPIWRLINVATEFPDTAVGDEALWRFRNAEPREDEYFTIRANETTGSRELLYYYAIRPEQSCLQCHGKEVEKLARMESEARLATELNSLPSSDPPSNQTTIVLPDGSKVQTDRTPLMAMARIVAPLDSMEAQLSRNRAVLLASGIVTSFLAMMAAYAIVRYIIVKPVLHLKDVSDEIARGNLNLRAEISTGDEFEELGHAFNRMLRHMMTVNDELRGLNLNLDGKVDQLARANMELFNNNKLKDDFLATMSHELRTPLNSILGFSDILQGAANLDDRQKRYVNNIQTSGQSLMVQINDLLDLAKIESGKMEMHLDRVELSDIVEQQVQQIMPLADRKNIDLRIDASTQALPSLQQDRGKISQILNNLLSNAIKFTPEGGRVRVAFRQLNNDTVEFSVEDTGIGIPLDEQEHIFEKFRQGSTAPGERDHVKREYEGTGLGLSIVRELSRLLGGDVSLQSEFGKGSLFVVKLPVHAGRKKTADATIILESRSAAGLGRITSVDLMNPPRSESQHAQTVDSQEERSQSTTSADTQQTEN